MRSFLSLLGLTLSLASINTHARDLQSLTTLEVFDIISSECTIKIGDQTMNFADVDSINTSEIRMRTEAIDGVFAELRLGFDDRGVTKNSKIERSKGLNSVTLRMDNAKPGFGSSVIKTQTVKKVDIVYAGYKQQDLILTGEAWLATDPQTKQAISQKGTLTCKVATFVNMMDLTNK